MKPPRSTVVVERLILVLCLCAMMSFISYEFGRYVEYKQCPAPEIKRGVKKLHTQSMDKKTLQRWSRYYASRSA